MGGSLNFTLKILWALSVVASFWYFDQDSPYLTLWDNQHKGRAPSSQDDNILGAIYKDLFNSINLHRFVEVPIEMII